MSQALRVSPFRPAFRAATLLISLLGLSCNTSGLKKVYMAPDSQGTVDRIQFVAGAPVFCVADLAIGDTKATLKVSMRPVVLNGQKVDFPPLLVAEHLPGKYTGKIGTEFPKLAVQAIPDPRDPNKFTTSQTAQTPGRYQCVVELDDEADYVDFEILPGQAATTDPNAPAPGACQPETVATCPIAGGGGNIVRCCTLGGACGTGPVGTGFCYPSR